MCPFCCLAGAFNTVTGRLHWELLARARAVDNLLRTCFAARTCDSYATGVLQLSLLPTPPDMCPCCCLAGAFNTVTGPLHWELLARARAVDNQCFVITCSPARNPEAGYQAWGHSTVVGPFAEVLATCEHEPTTVYAELDFAQVCKFGGMQ
jgi:predicted amidohydrolase